MPRRVCLTSLSNPCGGGYEDEACKRSVMSQNPTTIAPQPGIMEIALYEGGAAKVAPLDEIPKEIIGYAG